MPSIDHSHGRNSFGADPDAYHAARPPYPTALFDWLRQTCGLSETSACFEIGAGTGLATLPMLALPVGSILAIEPDARLAEALRRQAPPSAGLSIAIARFEDVELPAASLDFGFAATSLHWLPRGKALAKAHAALRPGGWFAAFWQVFHDPERPDAFDLATSHLFDGLEQGAASARPRKAFALDTRARLDDLRAAGFETCEARLFPVRVAFTGTSLARLYASLSRVAGAPWHIRDRLLAEIARIARDDFRDLIEREVVASAYIGRRAK
jgi:SAM-dependent methyltransferase